MKNCIHFISLILFGLVSVSCAQKQEGVKEYPSLHGQITYFQEKDELYRTFPIERGDIVFMGDDVADRGMWDAFYGADNIKNRGIALEGTECTLYRIGDVVKNRPGIVVISTGLYDLKRGCSVQETKERIIEILKVAKAVSPKTKCYYMSIVPDLGSKDIEGSVADSAEVVNSYIKELFPENFIDLNPHLCDEGGYICENYCVGPNRINGAGYEKIAKVVAPYIGLDARNTIAIDPIMLNADNNISPLEYYAKAYKETCKGRSAHYIARLSIFRSIPNTNGKVVMLGNSITNNCWWNELLGLSPSEIINRGISGDTILGILARLDEVVDENPSRICLLAGVNDMLEDKEVAKEEVWNRYVQLLEAIRERMPDVDLTISSTLPLNPMTSFYPGVNEKVAYLNGQLKANAQKYSYSYVDVAPVLMDENGDLSNKHTCDGIHLLPSAYHMWKELL